jgi:hypothetical protein
VASFIVGACMYILYLCIYIHKPKKCLRHYHKIKTLLNALSNIAQIIFKTHEFLKNDVGTLYCGNEPHDI